MSSPLPLTQRQTLLVWSCFYLPLDPGVCGGPPQSNGFLKAIRTRSSACWWFGSRYLRPTGDRRAGAHWGESRTVERDSSGTRNTAFRTN